MGKVSALLLDSASCGCYTDKKERERIENMKIIERIVAKKKDRLGAPAPTIVCLGDSVTEGCFECYKKTETHIETVFERKSSYSARLFELLSLLYPTVQVNIVNCGVSGASAEDGVRALEGEVLSHHPDLVVISYGLNDCYNGPDGLAAYKSALGTLFERITATGAEIIFLTENYMCTEVSPHLHDAPSRSLAEEFAENQNGGVLASYFEAAKELAREYGVRVCDLYRVWEQMEKGGVDVTALLSNHLNHPLREYHYYIAVKLYETMLT